MEDTITPSTVDLNESTAVKPASSQPAKPARSNSQSASDIVNSIATKQADPAMLIIMEGPNQGASIVLNLDEVILGMHGERWLKLTRTSDGYCAIALDPTVLVVRNGSPLPPTPQLLEDGDAIGMSDFVMTYGSSQSGD